MMNLLPLLASLLIFTAAFDGPGSSPDQPNLYEKASAVTAWVVAGDSSGSGVLVDVNRRLVVTNFHVVSSSGKIAVCFPARKDGKLIVERAYYRQRLAEIGIPARILKCDPKRDLALIELQSLPTGVLPLPHAAASASPGERVHSVGNPGASEALWVYTSGAVRQVYRTKQPLSVREPFPVEAMMVEMQAPINPGDSGGPVINEKGELLGILRAVHRNAQQFSYAIDIREVKSLLAGENQTVDRVVSEALEGAQLKYSVTIFGEFRVDFQTPKKETIRVSVTSATEEFGPLQAREVRSVAYSSPRPLSGALALRLVQLNGGYKLGGWSVRQVAGKHLVVFVLKIDSRVTPETLKAAVRYVLLVVQEHGDEVTRLANLGNIGLDTLSGSWKSMSGDQPSECHLQFGRDGLFLLRIDSITYQGRYDPVEGLLRVVVEGKQGTLGAVQSADAEKLTIQLKERRLNFVRASAAASSPTPASAAAPQLSALNAASTAIGDHAR